MSENDSHVGAKGVPGNAPRLASYVYWGAVAGVLAAMASLFAISLYYGSTVTDSPADCAAFGGAFTVLLSQPAALVGLLAGAATGAVVGGAAICARHFRLAG